MRALQLRVGCWVTNAFGIDVLTNRKERAMRVLEEAIELAQAEGIDFADVTRVQLHVYARPVGEPAQEASGIGTTLFAWCVAAGVNLDELLDAELTRIESPEVMARCRAKNLQKREAGISAIKPAKVT